MAKFTDIKSKKTYKPIVLIIIDGWGLSPSWGGNAITMANPKNLNLLWRLYPHKILQSFSEIAGPYVKVGNSEIGHTSIGAGKMICHDLVRISQAIKDGTFFKNKVLLSTLNHAVKNKSNLHLIGLLSDGAVHSHIDHLFALLELCREHNFKNVYIHAILDGQDTKPIEALNFLYKLGQKFKEIGFGKIASVCGRFYAMDRDNHWDRTAKAYQAIAQGIGQQSENLKEAIKQFYFKGTTDTYIPPIVAVENGQPIGKINDGDAVIFFNTRADRARQLCRAFVDPDIFRKLIFWRKFPIISLYFTTLTSYGLRLKVNVAFPPIKIEPTLAKILSEAGLRQLHIAESEKYAHVTYFLNGGQEEPFKDEQRIIVPSPKISPLDLQPELSTPKVVSELVKNVKSGDFDFLVVNLPNVDLIGHTGNIIAISKAVLTVDWAVLKIVKETLKVGGAVMVTADHGNAEQMIHLEGGDPETFHTLNPVPIILVTPDNKKGKLAVLPESFSALSEILAAKDTLADIAPTILEMFGISKPDAMEGKSLLGALI